MHMQQDAFDVLLVDDDRNVARLMKWLLAGQGFEMHLTQSGEEAIDVLSRHDVDVVVTDVEMPGGMSGLDLLSTVRDNWPESEVVVVSGWDRTNDALFATRNGAFDYLAKPWEPKVFIETIRRAATRSRQRRVDLDLPSEGRSDTLILESRSPELRTAMRRLSRVAELDDYDVLITGPTGVGKSVFARLLHDRSARRDQPFVTIDCGSMVSQLVESELFGHVRGAFTGADEDRKGLGVSRGVL